MTKHHLDRIVSLCFLGLIAIGLSRVSCADVIIQQQSTFDFAFIKAHGATTESTTADKQRRDSEFHCEGFMSLLCGNSQSGEILRLDRDLTWTLDPKKKQYRETSFPTPEQRQQAQQQLRETMEKMKQCPVAPRDTAPAPDTSKCEMSTPTFEVKATESHATLAGHDAKLTQMVMTQSCRNRETGDECKFVIAMDIWLTQDQIAGMDEDKAFRLAYLKKLGLDPQSALTQQQMKQFLAPYQDSLQQLASKSAELRGYPLKTRVRIAFGGEKCSSAKQSASGASPLPDASQAAGDAAAAATTSAAGAAAGTAAANAAGNSVAGSVLGSAANAFGNKLVGGLFAKKKAGTAQAPPSQAAAAPDAIPAGMVQAVQFTIETTSIVTGSVPASQFDIPPGWQRITEKQGATKEFTCPKSGT